MKQIQTTILLMICLSTVLLGQITWTSRTSGTTAPLSGVTYGNNQYVAVGYGGLILTSLDGITWTSRTSGTTAPLSGVTYVNNQYVAVGGNSTGTILTSADGITWTNRTLGTTNSLRRVTYGNNQYVAVGDGGTILTSTDGITWTSRTSGTTNILNDVTYGNNQYVAVGGLSGTGTILTSTDGITWTSRTSGSANWLYGVTYGNNQYVAVGGSSTGTVLTSADGITWTSRTSGTTTTLTGVTYGNNQYVAICGSSTGKILTSLDGIIWTNRTSGTTYSFFGLTYGNNLYVAVGSNGSICTSPWELVLPAPTLTSPANLSMGIATSPTLSWGTVSGAVTYRVQVSTESTFTTTIVNDSTITVGTKLLTVIANNKLYYWRVNAKSTWSTSVWSTVFNFTTIPVAPVSPTLTLPTNAATNVALAPTLTWGTVLGAATYRVQLSTISTFTTTIADDSTQTVSSKAITGLANNTAYFWRVNAKNSGGTSAWSSASSFTTIVAAPIAPTLTAPINAATGVTNPPTLLWGTIFGAATYRVQLSTTSTFATTVADDSTLTVGTKGTIANVPNGTKYYWRVNAKNTGGTSAWSTIWNFTTSFVLGINSVSHYTSATMGHNGILEVYTANGSRVMEVHYESSATKTQLLNTAYKSLAKGYYTYRFRSVDAKVDVVGNLIK